MMSNPYHMAMYMSGMPPQMGNYGAMYYPGYMYPMYNPYMNGYMPNPAMMHQFQSNNNSEKSKSNEANEKKC